jgi:membrane-bound metal-dependent hydrolase YbcI (DUF457 family)
MFLSHFAVGLVGKRYAPAISLGTWFLAVQFVDLLWPFFLLAGVEQVRVVPGITAFTPFDFSHYPITHSLVGGVVWALLLAAGSGAFYRNANAAMLLAAGVISHWVLDVISHRPDMPVLPSGPYLGFGLWNSIPATIAVELLIFISGIFVYSRDRRPTPAFWLMVGFMLFAFFGAAFGPTPPEDVTALALSALAVWLFVPWAWWADRAAKRV